MRREEDARREEEARREEAERVAQLPPPATPTIAPESVPSEPTQAKTNASGSGRIGEWTQSEPAALLDAALKKFRDLGASPARQDEGTRSAPAPRPVTAPIAAPPSTPSQYSAPPPHPTPPLQPAPPLMDALKELESYEPGLSQETWPTTSAEQVRPRQTFDFGSGQQ